jgi:alpha-glucoside transport system substrate-binding protein
VAPTFVDLGTVDGRLVGLFVKATAKGLVWYSPRIFRGLLPSEYEDLTLIAQSKLTEDTHEWCLGLESGEASGWPGTDWIETLVLHESGLEAYDRWVRGDLAWTSAEVRRAFATYLKLVVGDAVLGGPSFALRTSFEAAGAPLFTEPPGCLFLLQGAFMPVFFEAHGLVAGEDFDFFPFPSMAGPDRGAVLGAGDVMGLFTDDPRAAQLLEYLVGTEAQDAWVAQGGALSVNQGVTAYPDDLTRRAAEHLSSAPHFRFDGSDMMAPALNKAFWQAVLDVTADPARLDEVLAGLDRIGSGGG